MKVLLSALVLCCAVGVSAKTTTFVKGDSAYSVKTSADGSVTVYAHNNEPCGNGELYPCPGDANHRDGGAVMPPAEPCGNGELYPCPGVAHPREGGMVNPPSEPCGNGELYPCQVTTHGRAVVVARYSASGKMECGGGELYPCDDVVGNERSGGRVAAPEEACGAGELYPCAPGRVDSRGGHGNHHGTPREECGAGELYPCTTPRTAAVVEHVETWISNQGFRKAE